MHSCWSLIGRLEAIQVCMHRYTGTPIQVHKDTGILVYRYTYAGTYRPKGVISVDIWTTHVPLRFEEEVCEF